MASTETDRSFVERNAASRERLRRLTEAGDEALRGKLADGWTVAATLAHLAFWDRWVLERWDRYARDGAFDDLPAVVTDLTNAAGLPGWLALEPARAAALALEAAEAVDRRIAALPAAAIADAVATGRPVMLDRSLHREAHLDEIERAATT